MSNSMLPQGQSHHEPLSIFAWMGKLAYRYRRWVIGLWAILLIVSLILVPSLERSLQGTGTVYEAGEAHRTEQQLQQELDIAADALTVVFERTIAGSLMQNRAEIDDMLAEIAKLPAVESIDRFSEQQYLSPDQRVAYSLVHLNVSGEAVTPVIEQIERVLVRTVSVLKTYVTGQAVVDRDAQRISKADLARAELLTLPLTLIALLFVFGSAIAAALPLAMGLMTVSVTLGLLSLIALHLDVSIFAINITTMLGLGIGIDASLLMVNRFREELRSASVEQAVITTTATAGEAVFYSGLTTCIGLVSLLLFPIVLLRSLGVAGSLVVLMSMAAVLTLVPALLGLLGHGINRWQIVRTLPERDRLWRTIAQTVTRHSVLATAFVIVVVSILASPFGSARFGLGDVNILPQSVPARQGVEAIEQRFAPGELSPILLAVSTTSPTDRILSAEHVATLHGFVAELESNPAIERVNSLFNFDPALDLQTYQQFYQTPAAIPIAPLKAAVPRLSSDTTTLITIHSRNDSNDPAARDLVRQLRQRSLAGLQLQVGGQTAQQLDTIQVVLQRLPWVLTAIIGVTFLSLCVLFQSVLLPIKAIFLNLMSIAASFGALVFVFQQGHFQTWLNFTPLGYLDILLPIVLFCVLFGLSMDYEVFLLTRIKEAYDHSGNNTLSVVEGLERTGRIITSAALLMIIVTGAFALTSIIFVKALGLGIALAVLIDSTLIRAILVPASMHLMGRWNWWAPRFPGLRSRHPV